MTTPRKMAEFERKLRPKKFEGDEGFLRFVDLIFLNLNHEEAERGAKKATDRFRLAGWDWHVTPPVFRDRHHVYRFHLRHPAFAQGALLTTEEVERLKQLAAKSGDTSQSAPSEEKRESGSPTRRRRDTRRRT